VEDFATAEAAEQRRWHTRAGAQCSGGDVVGFGHGRWHGRDSARETRRGGVGSVAVSSDTTGQDGARETRRGGIGSAAASSDTADRKQPVGTGVREARRWRGLDNGEELLERRCRSAPLWHGAGRLTGGPLMSMISEIKFTPGRK
jgi:hypothetical protein